MLIKIFDKRLDKIEKILLNTENREKDKNNDSTKKDNALKYFYETLTSF